MMCSPVARRDRLLCRPTARCWKPIGIPPLAIAVVLACAPLCSASGDCSAARDLLASTLGGGDHKWTQVLAASPTTGDSLTLCRPPASSSGTCCTPATERRLREAAWEHFRLRLRDSTAPLRRFLDDSLALFRERLSSLVSEAERSTELLFSDVYAERVAAEARGPVGRLFRALRARLGLPPAPGGHAEEEAPGEEDPVDAFFGDLFPLVYFHTVNPRLADFSDEYKRCLRGAQGRLRPFGDAPLRLKGSLSESLGGARTTLRATRLALEVVNASGSPPDDAEPQCGRALARALGCGACASLPPVMPQVCGGLCVEAARGGCLRPVEALLEGPWGELVSALHRLLPRLVGAYSLDEALSLLDSRVSEAVMHAMENGPELAKRVKLECGDPRRRAATNRTGAELPAATVGPSGRRPAGAPLRGADAALRSRQRELLRQLSASRPLFSSLAGSVCAGVSGPPPCWDGARLGRYEKPAVGGQLEKPETKHQASSWDTLLASQARRLKEMTTEVLSLRVSLMPDSDSYTLEGSGSGAPPNGPWDDEEFAEGSGSGDDNEEAAPSSTARSPAVSTPAPPPKTAGSSVASSATAALVVALLGACRRLWS